MGKALYIAEKPSVAQEFAKVLHIKARKQDGYLESEEAIVTWCVGHLVTMSYPEAYGEQYKKWSMETLPFLPDTFLYEVIPAVSKQFRIVSGLLNRADVDCIYVCTDSGREGEYIYRLVEQQADVRGKTRKRVWIDSQTEEEIRRGIREAKDLSEYDNLSASAYLRAKEDYLMGINFSRLLTLEYGRGISGYLNRKYTVISVGRVMTCVLGMVVRREREIREFQETVFYKPLAKLQDLDLEGEWKVSEGSDWYEAPGLYKEIGFLKEEDGLEFCRILKKTEPLEAAITRIEKKKEKKNPPLLYNLAELQNECSKRFKISPDETLKVAQELYEKKLITYPRTDARVLSAAVAKEIHKNLNGLMGYEEAVPFLQEIVAMNSHKNLAKTRYVNDKQITDHYAIIPTGQGLSALGRTSGITRDIYRLIVFRFLSIFYPAAVYNKLSVAFAVGKEQFSASVKVLEKEGYLKVGSKETEDAQQEQAGRFAKWNSLKKGSRLPVEDIYLKEGKTSPPKRYSSGSLILAMENAGQLIEDEELRVQIKGSGIGTSATRGEILKKLFHIKYLALNKKTQIVTPTMMGEMIHDVVRMSIPPMLNPDLTASWEKGLNYVANGEISAEEYDRKLKEFISRRTSVVKQLHNGAQLQRQYAQVQKIYQENGASHKRSARKRASGKEAEEKQAAADA